MHDLVSIIIPVYNLEGYLKRCIDSVLGQTYQNLEVIIIDDGSTDKSPEICDEYQKIDERIKVIHTENMGVSVARNTGLNTAKGKYIGFVDSDDWIDKDMYEYLVQNIEINHCDIACCRHYKEYEDRTEVASIEKNILTNSFYDSLDNLIDERYDGFVGNKLFRKSVLKHRFDTDLSVGEDGHFFYHAIKQAQGVFYSALPKYHYTIRAGSATNTTFTLKKLDALKSMDRIYDDVVANNPDYADRVNVLVFNIYLRVLNMMLYYYKDDQYKDEFDKIVEKLTTIFPQNRKINPSKFKIIMFRLFKINKQTYRLIIRYYYKNKFLI